MAPCSPWMQSKKISKGEMEHPQHGKLRTIVAKVVRSTYFLSPPRRDADGPSCATSLATLRSRIKEARARGDEADRLEAVECEVTKLYKEGYVPEAADWEKVYRSSLGAVLGYTGVDRTEDLEADGEREPRAWRRRHVTNIEFKELLSALHLVTRRPPHSVFLSHRLAVYFCVTHARLWLERSPTFPFAAFRNISCACTMTVSQGMGLFSKQKWKIPTWKQIWKQKKWKIQISKQKKWKIHLIEAAEEVVLQSPLGYLERVPSFVESMQRKEALSLLYDDTGGAFVYPLPSPQCPTVLFSWLASAIRRTFWYETKLQVFVKDEALHSKYSNITSFLDFVIEDHRPVSLAERMGFVATCKTEDEKGVAKSNSGLLTEPSYDPSSKPKVGDTASEEIPSLDTDFEGKLPSLSDTEFSKDFGSYLEEQWPNIWKYICGGLLVALSIFASQGWGGPQCVCT
ncbi:hypothetical protein SELMODRAFT_431129 [Selaginella moellendorffii]|uniref:Uncharacterized protein n=1 Tax=Selaginella moellendorffii TaxID=88036 RepID=D8TBL9_SELML|nr:hypothetical protein SELMODRAFT_431129 [Selaginella moellendorffii]